MAAEGHRDSESAGSRCKPGRFCEVQVASNPDGRLVASVLQECEGDGAGREGVLRGAAGCRVAGKQRFGGWLWELQVLLTEKQCHQQKRKINQKTLTKLRNLTKATAIKLG